MTQFDMVVGLDLSLTSTGVAIWDGLAGQIQLHRIRSTGTKTDTWSQRHQRITKLAADIDALITSTRTFILIEAPAYGSTTGSVWDRAGAWWKVYSLLEAWGDSILPIEPSVVKKFATGKGNADKDAVLAAVVRRYPDIDVTGNDQADAVALLDIGMHLAGQPLAQLPTVNRSVLDRLSIPTEQEAA